MLMQAPVTMLSVSPFAEDHEVLAGIFHPYGWMLHRASTLGAGTRFLWSQSISLVVVAGPTRGSWNNSRDRAGDRHPRHDDDYLWAEALNLGAYGVLAKPFNVAEVRSTLTIAAFKWGWKRASRCRVSPGAPDSC